MHSLFRFTVAYRSVFVRNGEREAATSRNQPTEDFHALGPSTNQPSAPHAQMVKTFTLTQGRNAGSMRRLRTYCPKILLVKKYHWSNTFLKILHAFHTLHISRKSEPLFILVFGRVSSFWMCFQYLDVPRCSL